MSEPATAIADPQPPPAAIAAPPGPALDALDRRLDALVAMIGRDRPVVLADYPLYLNIGDLLIDAGTDAFLARAGIPVAGRFTIANFGRKAHRAIGDGATILLTGGGSFGDLWPAFQHFRETVVRRFPANRVVVLPQTVRWRDAAAAAASRRVLEAHRDLHLAVRDAESLAWPLDRPRRLMPDMAHALHGTPMLATAMAAGRADPAAGPLVLARTDHERRSAGAGAVGDAPRGVDWGDLIGPGDRRRINAFRLWHAADRRCGNRLAPGRAWQAGRDRLIARMAARLARHPEIHTDRLHGVILGALLERSVRFADTADGKVSGYHRAWLADLPTVRPGAAP